MVMVIPTIVESTPGVALSVKRRPSSVTRPLRGTSAPVTGFPSLVEWAPVSPLFEGIKASATVDGIDRALFGSPNGHVSTLPPLNQFTPGPEDLPFH